LDYINIALAKGRLADKAYIMLKKAGLGDCIDPNSRKLIFKDDSKKISFIYVKPSDVVTYVQNGVADLGVAGKDVILESDSDVYEILDLGFGKCKFAVAGLKGEKIYKKDEVLRVATKYPKVSKRFFAEKEQRIKLIKLNGSVELAPLVGLSDVIVDLVETGNTLKVNGLEIIEDMFEVSAKLICNRVSYRFKYDRISKLLDKLKRLEGQCCEDN
jgi:ATP phosphoribosyltransferase